MKIKIKATVPIKKVFLDLCIFLRLRRANKIIQSTKVKIPFRLPEILTLYKAAAIPKLERINEFLKFIIFQKNTPTVITAYGLLFSKNEERFFEYLGSLKNKSI